MTDIISFFKKLFDYSDWPPRWHCGNWTSFHGWLYIVSDLMIWSAYFAIPVLIISFLMKRKDIRFHKLYILFASFILACGLTHLLDVIMFWVPVYRLNALVRFVTGIISWVTVYYIFKNIPLAFSLKSPEQLQREIDSRQHVEKELKIKNDQLNSAQSLAGTGNWEWNVKTNELIWSPGLYKIYGIKENNAGIDYDSYINRIHPADRSYVESILEGAFKEKKLNDYYHRIILPDGTIKTLFAKGEVLTNPAGEIMQIRGASLDVTDQKSVEEELLIKTKSLEVMNVELQKFAYVASHDLKEPLRKIVTFNSRLQHEYKDKIDERGQGYMDKIVNASLRMQTLIDDVLEFSNVSNERGTIEKIDLNKIVDQVISDMEIKIEQTKAEINIDKLPVIDGNGTQLGQLFQNLLSNAIKFRRENIAPRITISCTILNANEINTFNTSLNNSFRILNDPAYLQEEKYCRIIVSDNGIGFDESFSDRIFAVFQRLHSRNTFEGTGIGLAITKKIVDNHQGFITAKSKPGEGSRFIITLPILQKETAAAGFIPLK